MIDIAQLAVAALLLLVFLAIVLILVAAGGLLFVSWLTDRFRWHGDD
jgi:hypothetical protein